MNEDKLAELLKQAVEKMGLKQVQVASEVSRLWIHVVIVSPDFENLSQMQRENIAWKAFEQTFDDRTLLSISQCYLLSPEEYQAQMGDVELQAV